MTLSNYREEVFTFVINPMYHLGVSIDWLLWLLHDAFSPYSSLGELPCVLFDIPDGHSSKQPVAQQQSINVKQPTVSQVME